MVDILLIQPPIRDFYITLKRTIPYGLSCIASSLMDAGFSVEILDALATSKSRKLELPEEMSYLEEYYGNEDLSPFALFHNFKHFGYSFEHIGKKAAGSGAFLVGISSLFTPYAGCALETAESVKAFNPSCKTVIGGHHPTALPHSVMENSAVDYVIRGEGEASMPLLVRALKENKTPDQVPGLVFREKDGSIRVNEPAIMQDPDKYPLPATDLLNSSFYTRGGLAGAVVTASRGCPMNCSYCSVGSASFLKYRKRSVESVIKEIGRLVDLHGARFIDFEDENLSLDREWFLKLLKEIKKRFAEIGLELRAMNGLFPPSLDEEVISQMKGAGFKELNLSLGSFSASQLNRFGRPDIRKYFDRVLFLAEKHMLQAVGYIIAGAPFQNPRDSVSDLIHLAKRRVLAGVSIFYPSPGSLDYELCNKNGLLPESFSLMRSSAFPVSHTTGRRQAVTILRLGRIVNFMKYLKDNGRVIPGPSLCMNMKMSPAERTETGEKLLAMFLYDGKIRGINRSGDIYEHEICEETAGAFLEGFKRTEVRGTRL
jgi:radical SAM superfamily enzyme YgiQ (UPF0313 family)